MLKSISWREFLLWVSAALAAYYAITIVFFYSKEIVNKLKRSDRLPKFESDNDQSTNDHELSFIGAIDKEPSFQNVHEVEEVLSAEDMQINAVQIQALETDDVNQTTIQAPVTDLLNELDTLFEFLSEDKPGKEEAAPMIKSLVERYKARISDLKDQHAINRFIKSTAKEACDFDFQLDEVKSLWL